MYIPTFEEYEEAMDKRFSSNIYQKLKEAEVSIAGLGGLGSNIAVMLARTGIGHLHLIDFDQVDITNLNRQAYSAKHLGMDKTRALKSIIHEINPYIKITTNQVKITEDNVLEILGNKKLVCEAFDMPENKALLVHTLLEKSKNTIIVSGSGMAGYGKSNDIKTEKVMRNLYVCGDQVSDALEGIGLMSPRVSICAGHQANMIISLILM